MEIVNNGFATFKVLERRGALTLVERIYSPADASTAVYDGPFLIETRHLSDGHAPIRTKANS